MIEGRDIDVCIRSRPLLEHEIVNNFFEVVHSQKHTFHLMEPSLSLKKDARLKAEAYSVDFAFG